MRGVVWAERPVAHPRHNTPRRTHVADTDATPQEGVDRTEVGRDAGSGRIVSAEALLRWEHPERGMVSPVQFIPVAEESGLINSIGLWVLRKACCDALAWDDITLSVNISAAQLRNPEFPIQLGHILEETGFRPFIQPRSNLLRLDCLQIEAFVCGMSQWP